MNIPMDLSAPINVDRLEVHVVSRLREQILAGVHPDGSRLREEPLASQLGVSRGPIRDAFKVLSEEGLVELVPRRGAFVRWVPAEDLREIVLIRGSLEQVALRLAMQRDLDGICFALESRVREMDGAANHDDWEGILRAESSFHDCLYEGSGSRRLGQIWAHLRPTVLASFRNDRAYYSSRIDVGARHQRLLDVIRSGDEDSAALELAHHIQPTRVRASDDGNRNSEEQPAHE